MDLSTRLTRETDRIKSQIAADAQKSADIGQLLSPPGVFSGMIPPDRKAAELLQSSTGWVYACAGVIADEIAAVKVRLYRQRNGDIEEIEDHPALDILHRANDFTTKFDLFWLTGQYLELTGEAPWFLQFNGTVPSQILLLRPDRLEVTPGTDGQSIIAGYSYLVNGVKHNLESQEVVFLRYPDPDRQFRGRGPLQAAARTVDLEDYSEEYNRRFFYNSARPDGVLSTEQKLGRDQLEKLERRLSQKYKGIGNSHKTLILEKGLKWEPMALSQKDMEFLEQAKFSRDKILGIFRVPKTVLGLTEEVNRATAEAADYVFAKRTVKPKLERIIQQLNEFLLPLFPGTEDMFYDFDSPVPKDEAASLEFKKAALTQGWLSINEVRALDGYEPVEGGDELRVPITSVPLSQDVMPSDLTQPTRDFSDRLVALKARNRKGEASRKFKQATERQLVKLLAGYLHKKNGHAKKPVKLAKAEVDDDPKALEFQGKQLNIAGDFEGRYGKAVRRVFQAQRAEVLARFGKGQKDLDWRSFMLLPEKERKRFAAELSAIVADLIVSQAAEAFTYIGLDQTFDVSNPAIAGFLEKRAFKFAKPTTLLTNRLLGRSLREGISAGEGIPDLRKRVDSVFGGMEKYRAERIARSETIRATNYASEEAWRQSGVVKSKQWLTAMDERTCEWCGPMNGKIIGLGDSWFDRGTALAGNQGGTLNLDYETVERPPLHPNCRCTLVPVVTKSAPKPADPVDEAVDKILNDEKPNG